MIIKRSTITLLRFPFSIFLLPVFLFALSQPLHTNWGRAVLLFIILHLLVYPSSNGYNSYMDRDTGPIGGIQEPPPPDPELKWVTIAMDLLAVTLAIILSIWCAIAIVVFILASRAYSSRSIRIKKYPYLGFLLVICCQGGLVFWITYHATHAQLSTNVPWTGMLASSLLLAGAYPLTQVYQHRADAADGITTISMKAGIRGTFLLSGLFFMLAFMVLGLHFALQLEIERFILLLVCFNPVLLYFFSWARRVWNDPEKASFQYLMKMNTISAICSIVGFGSLLIWKLFD